MPPRITRRRILFALAIVIGVILIGAELYFLSPWLRRLCVNGAERIGADDYLAGRLSDRDMTVRSEAGEALVHRGARAVPALVARLADPEAGNRRLVASTLARIGSPAVEAAPALKRAAIEDTDEGVLETAGAALGKVARDHPERVLEIIAMLESHPDSIRLAGIRAAACLDDARAVPVLMAALKDPNPKIREEAAEALGELKNLATAAIPVLIELLDDQDAAVRTEARQAIPKIIRVAANQLDPELVASAKKAVDKSMLNSAGIKQK